MSQSPLIEIETEHAEYLIHKSSKSRNKYPQIFMPLGLILGLLGILFINIHFRQCKASFKKIAAYYAEEYLVIDSLRKVIDNMIFEIPIDLISTFPFSLECFFSYLIDSNSYFFFVVEWFIYLSCFGYIGLRLYVFVISTCITYPIFVVSLITGAIVFIQFYFLTKNLFSIKAVAIFLPIILFSTHFFTMIIAGAGIVKKCPGKSAKKFIDSFNEKQKNELLPKFKDFCENLKFDINNIYYTPFESKKEKKDTETICLRDMWCSYILHRNVDLSSSANIEFLVENTKVFILQCKSKMPLLINFQYFGFSIITLTIFILCALFLQNKITSTRLYILLTSVFVLINHILLNYLIGYFNKKHYSNLIDLAKTENIDQMVLLNFFESFYEARPHLRFQDSRYRMRSIIEDFEIIYKKITGEPLKFAHDINNVKIPKFTYSKKIEFNI